MTDWKYRIKLSKGSLLLLHLAAAGHVWRDVFTRRWVASTIHTKRDVDYRINNIIGRGFLKATFEDNFPQITPLGYEYLADHPLEDVLETEVIR